MAFALIIKHCKTERLFCGSFRYPHIPVISPIPLTLLHQSSTTEPINSKAPVSLSRITKKNGRFHNHLKRLFRDDRRSNPDLRGGHGCGFGALLIDFRERLEFDAAPL